MNDIEIEAKIVEELDIAFQYLGARIEAFKLDEEHITVTVVSDVFSMMRQPIRHGMLQDILRHNYLPTVAQYKIYYNTLTLGEWDNLHGQ
jgi:stress-induced morphogen